MPTFPTTIANPYSQDIGASSLVGPFEVASVLYVFPVEDLPFPATNAVLNCYKSLDLGATWTQIGGNSSSVQDVPSCVCAVLVGTKVYIVAPGSAPIGGGIFLQVIVFDLVAGTFSPGVVTTNKYFGGGGGWQEIAAAYRPTDGQLVISAVMANSGMVPTETRTGYFLYDVAGSTWGAWVPCGFIGVSTSDWNVSAVLRGNGMMHFLFYVGFPGVGGIYQQALLDSGVLGTFQIISTGFFIGNSGAIASVEGNTVVMGGTKDDVTIQVFTGVSADPITFTETDYVYPGTTFQTPCAVRSGGANYLLLLGDQGSGREFGYVKDSGSGYGPYIFLDNSDSNYFYPFGTKLTDYIWGAMLPGSLFFFALAPPPPPPPPAPPQKVSTGGGTYFPRFVNKTLLHAQIARIVGPVNQIRAYREFAPLSWLYDFPNDNDICLSREWRLYHQIDPQALSCARKPDCFSGEEGSRPWVEPPPGAVTFNPDKAIPLPAPAAVDVVVLSFRVPIGFDGIVLAQYHSYRGQGTFIEASGDIIWRVRVNGRYLRDMGNMQLSIGSPQTLSPCPGGLWLHSGNLVEYTVSAPNGSGSLPLPGQGNILAGLHGYFWPRI